jgi:type IV secretion system protein VirB9
LKKILLLIYIIFNIQLFADTNYFSEDSYRLDEREWESVKQAKKWLNNDIRSMKGRDGRITFLYGATMPSVICSPLKITDIQLEMGEELKSIQAGDTARWNFSTDVSGSGKNEVVHIIVKPLDLGLDTNLIIFTDRRTYNLKLVSKKYVWTPIVNFTYNSSLQNSLNNYKKYQKKRIDRYKKINSFEKSPQTKVDINNLDFNYEIEGDAQWKPIRVYNDGIKTFIQMPKDMSVREAPVLLVLDSASNKNLVNYRLKDDKYIVDKLFDSAILLLGVGADQESIMIYRVSNSNKSYKNKELKILIGDEDEY